MLSFHPRDLTTANYDTSVAIPHVLSGWPQSELLSPLHTAEHMQIFGRTTLSFPEALIFKGYQAASNAEPPTLGPSPLRLFIASQLNSKVTQPTGMPTKDMPG